MRYRIAMGGLVLAAYLPALAAAQQGTAAATTPMTVSPREGTWELSVGAGATLLDAALAKWVQVTSRGSSRVAQGGVVRIGFHFSGAWGVNAGVLVAYTSPATVIQPIAGITWTPNLDSRTSPYLRAGFGGTHTSWSDSTCSGRSCSLTGLGVNLGAGLRQMLSEKLALRIEVREQYERYDAASIAKPVFNSTGTISLSWFFGGGRTGVASVALNPQTVTLESLGATQQVSASPRDRRNRLLLNRTVTWTSTNDSVASVSSTGLVTAVSNGSATISATSEGATTTVDVTVAQTAATLAIAPPSATLTALGQTQSFTASGQDASHNPIASPSVTWISSDPTVASVTASGVATAVKSGTATITASTANSRAATATVTVTQAPAAVAVLPPTGTIAAVGDTTRFTAQPVDANGNAIVGTTPIWASDAPRVALVSSSGLARAVGNGTARISATVAGTTGTATLTVALRAAPAAPSTELPATSPTLVLQIVFHPNSAALPPEALSQLDTVAAAIGAIPGARWEISGHTSSMGDSTQNVRLSQRRALAVLRYLVQQGVPAASLTSVGWGGTRPVATNTTVAGRRQNMRVQIRRLR
jgi:outer membrane protein OmpA-like peptidoglycan-associated protein